MELSGTMTKACVPSLKPNLHVSHFKINDIFWHTMQHVTNTWLGTENPNIPYLNLGVVLAIITASSLLSNIPNL